MTAETAYPPIADYGFISDCHSAALVSRDGSIDWCCMPRFDASSCFGRLLSWTKGGYCRIRPTGRYQASRRYLPDTLVLETVFECDGGKARLLDCMTVHEGGEHHPHRQILRILEGIEGKMQFAVEVDPVFDYGAVKPWIQERDHYFVALGSNNGLLISSDGPLRMKHRHRLFGEWRIEEGRRAHLSILWRPPENLEEGLTAEPAIPELDDRLDETVDWWKNWLSQGSIAGDYAAAVTRSAIILKGLSYAPTGAIIAAATTSLPEAVGGSRNWDYRFSWIRDSYFTVRSLAELGFVKEADGFRRFVERTAAGSADDIQVFFGVGGERRLSERQLDDVEGYRRSRPVRIGNAAERQRQLDVYGELLGLAWIWHRQGQSPDDDYWEFLVSLINQAARNWIYPDRGIWEMRCRPRHFVQSKVMCWSALDRGIRLARETGRDGPLDEWRRQRDKIRKAVEERGCDHQRGVFVQAFNFPAMDASLLLLPMTGFVDYRDERMIRTADAVREELEQDGLLRRYAADSDELDDIEGVFCCCSFWLAECFARQGRREEARRVFERAMTLGNDLGIYSEEYDPRTGEMLGNMPQGLTHLSLIAAAVAIADGGD
jgi:GH15 family glucan-1,4-alpha-glucosidase